MERLLLGNKCDMEAKRKVQREQADKVRVSRARFRGGRAEHSLGAPALFPTSFLPPRQLAREHGIRFFETSAKSSMNVDEVRYPAPRPGRETAPGGPALRPVLTAPLPARPSAPWPGTSYSSREAGER